MLHPRRAPLAKANAVGVSSSTPILTPGRTAAPASRRHVLWILGIIRNWSWNRQNPRAHFKHAVRAEDHSRGASMYDTELKLNGAEGRLVGNSIRSFCKSLVRRIHLRYSSAPQDQDKAAAASAHLETSQPAHEPINRVTKQGRFDWGSFSAFDDGSIEVERAGVRQRFRNFSELKRSLNHRSGDEGSAATGTWRLGS